MATVQEILNTKLSRPTFAFRPGQNKPLPDEIDFTRSGAAWTLDANRDIVKKADGIKRTYGPDQPLRIEPQRTQKVQSPDDFSTGDWSTQGSSVASGASTKNNVYQTLIESSNNENHRIFQGLSFGVDEAGAAAFLVRPNGRNWASIVLGVSGAQNATGWYDLSNGVKGTSGNEGGGSYDGTILEHEIFYIGGGFYLLKLSGLPPSGNAFTNVQLYLANSDQVLSYAGDGSSGIDLIYGGAEQGRFITTPILEGGAIRNEDSVDIDISSLNDEEGTYLFEAEIRSSSVGSSFSNLFRWVGEDRIETVATQNSPYLIGFQESGVGKNVDNQEVKAYERIRVALSVDNSEVRFAVNGDGSAGSYSGGILSVDELRINSAGDLPLHLYSASFEPELLSTTDLETLTTVV